MVLNLANYADKSAETMDDFVALISDLVKANGLKDATIVRDGHIPLTLPGYFRPTMQWDMLVLRENRLVAALKLKTQVETCGIDAEKNYGRCHSHRTGAVDGLSQRCIR